MLATRAAPPKRAPRPIAPVWYAAPPELVELAAAFEALEEALEIRELTDDSMEDWREAMDELNEATAEEAEAPVPVMVEAREENSEERED